MQHDVLDTVLQAFSGADVEPPLRSSFGLSVASVRLRAGRMEAGPAFALYAPMADVPAQHDHLGELIWDELVPAHPRRVRARNPSAAPIVVEPGSVLAGGMSTRAVATTRVVPPGGDVVVAVENVGARWWDEGRLRPGASLTQVETAVMLQARFGEGAAASSARTSLMSFSGSDRVAPATPAEQGGWVILEHDRVLAGWLAERSAAESERWASPTLGGASGHLGDAVIASLRRGLRDGALAAHVLDHELCGREWIVVPRTFDLVDAVTSSRD